MSDWITDRLPTVHDVNFDGKVWATSKGPNGDCVIKIFWECVLPSQPWQPILPPAPYVKPKRWTVEWDGVALWSLRFNGEHYGYLPYAGLPAASAQRICDIYNETVP